MSLESEPIPQIENKKVPTWIKVMWFFGISWVIMYICFGLASTPTDW